MRIAAALAVGAGLWGCFGGDAARATFRPVENQRYRYDMVETRTADGVARTFRARRSIVFRRTADGFEAIVTLESVASDAGVGVGPMFAAAGSALLHRPIRFRLDAAGHVIAAEDADAVVAVMADAIERIADGTPTAHARAADARALAAPLRSASPERKQAMLLSILRPVLFADEADRLAGTRAVTLPSRPPLPPHTALNGTETIARDGNAVTLDLDARGTLEPRLSSETPGSPFVPGGDATPGVSLRAHRKIDADTGLLVEGREATDTVVPSLDGSRHALLETIATLALDPG